jgi:UrcA family protein
MSAEDFAFSVASLVGRPFRWRHRRHEKREARQMNSSVLRYCLMLGAIAVVGSAAAGLPAPAQNAPAKSPAPLASAVTVVAPEVVRRPTTGTTRFHGSPVEVLSLQKVAEFGDLDLTTDAGVGTFHKRIRATAQAACAQLESEYPSRTYVPVPASQNCSQTATRSAMAVADEIVAAARAGAK